MASSRTMRRVRLEKPFKGLAMNYRHAFHAGNFADVAKHLALVTALLHLQKKDAPFVAVDSHAGRGSYDLASDQAKRTRESDSGIGRLRDMRSDSIALSTYLDLVGTGSFYPGSPLIAARLLRPQDRLIAIEKHPEEAAALAACLRPFRGAQVEITDGYARLASLLPPAERRGIVLIDPPYEAEDEFLMSARSFAGGFRRFATGIYLIWFPIKSRARADGFCGEILASGVQSALRLDVEQGKAREDRLTAAGMIIVNPPYTFERDMQTTLRQVLPLLEATERFNWLAGPK
jgi:23S rRNA (adenine2030-N6)-methyltransferase